MKGLAIAFAVFFFTSSVATAEQLSVKQAKHFYEDLFAVEVRTSDSGIMAIPIIRDVPAEHALSKLVRDSKRVLTYLLTNYSDLSYDSLRERATSGNAASTYLVEHLADSDRFSSAMLPIIAAALGEQGVDLDGVSPLVDRSVELAEIMRVAVRFFYVDGITPEGSLRARVCVGINGMVDQPFPRDPFLEALAYSAIMRDIQEGQKSVMPDFTRALLALRRLSLSENQEKAIARAQGGMWLAMSNSEALQNILTQEAHRTAPVLRLAITP